MHDQINNQIHIRKYLLRIRLIACMCCGICSEEFRKLGTAMVVLFKILTLDLFNTEYAYRIFWQHLMRSGIVGCVLSTKAVCQNLWLRMSLCYHQQPVMHCGSSMCCSWQYLMSNINYYLFTKAIYNWEKMDLATMSKSCTSYVEIQQKVSIVSMTLILLYFFSEQAWYVQHPMKLS